MRVLFQNRAGIAQQPGGDLVVMEQLRRQLEAAGAIVDFSADPCCDLTPYNVVHLFNLTLPDVTESFARNAVSQHVPFVVTSLQEDFPRFLNKCLAWAQLFKRYLRSGQNLKLWQNGSLDFHKNPPAPASFITSPFAIEHAGRLLTCGLTETKLIADAFPEGRCEQVHFGSSIKDSNVGPHLFEKHFGVREFVLCVGRLEARKNQLLLLKAFEDDEQPLVFADGGFTYQPWYAEMCKQFKRKGRSIFTGRLSDDLLISAFRAASVHCLPSWYELPGLVTLEAARYGCPAVASSWGAIRDYLGETAFYCEPDDPESVRLATERAMTRPNHDACRDKASAFTWDRSGRKLLGVYDDIKR